LTSLGELRSDVRFIPERVNSRRVVATDRRNVENAAVDRGRLRDVRART
jgi:hypothetical protein